MLKKYLELPDEPKPTVIDWICRIVGWVATAYFAFRSYGWIVKFLDNKYHYDIYSWTDDSHFYWVRNHETALELLVVGLVIVVAALCLVIFIFGSPYYWKFSSWWNKITPIIDEETEKLQSSSFKLLSSSPYSYQEEHDGLSVGPALVGGKMGVAFTPTTEVDSHDAISIKFLLNDKDVIITKIPLEDEEGYSNLEWTLGSENKICFPNAYYTSDGGICWNDYAEMTTTKEALAI